MLVLPVSHAASGLQLSRDGTACSLLLPSSPLSEMEAKKQSVHSVYLKHESRLVTKPIRTKPCHLPTRCIYVFHTILTLNSIIQLVFAMGMECVFCEVGSNFGLMFI
jgi:hypothetical protein